jgi:hypothetical protein
MPGFLAGRGGAAAGVNIQEILTGNLVKRNDCHQAARRRPAKGVKGIAIAAI